MPRASTNVQKSNVLSILCSDIDLAVIQEHLPCELQEFRRKYLWLPLSVRKLTKAQLQPIINGIADQLPGWKVDLTTQAGRAVQVQYVCSHSCLYIFPWPLNYQLGLSRQSKKFKEVSMERKGCQRRSLVNC